MAVQGQFKVNQKVVDFAVLLPIESTYATPY